MQNFVLVASLVLELAGGVALTFQKNLRFLRVNSSQEASNSTILHFGIIYSLNLPLRSKYSFGRPCNTVVDRVIQW